MKIVLDDIELLPGREGEGDVREAVERACGGRISGDIRLLRKSLDARKKGHILYRCRVAVELPDEEARNMLGRPGVSLYRETEAPPVIRARGGIRVAVVGTGPAGLFCALRLAEAGAEVELFERGRPVEERHDDVARLKNEGRLDPESNVLFGEGGAGTYSDGKLTARTHRPEADWFFRKMVEMGAPEEILYEAKPHVGTDRLITILKNIRQSLLSAGSALHFRERVTDILREGDRAAGLVAASGRECRAHAVVLASGHSARDVYAMLRRQGIALEAKGFAVGARIEHPAELISFIQYGKAALALPLPAAEYRLAWNDPRTGRGVYSFCMCPGGEVINASSEEEGLCVNGMSYSGRDLPRSNAALVVTVRPGDFGSDPLQGIAFQRDLERAAYRAGGGGFVAPAESVPGFLGNRGGGGFPETSYRPGVRASRLSEYLPAWIVEELRQALRRFDRQMRGFAGPEALLIGAETRTSSPVRVVRGGDLQSVSLRGLYPAGEGARSEEHTSELQSH